MGIEDFIRDALYKPNDYVAYHVGRELAELHPDKAIVEGRTGYFDLEAFVREKQCALVSETSVFNHLRTNWEQPDKNMTHAFENGWLNVLWRGQLLDVVLISWSESCYRRRHHWIVAESKKLAEEFFAAVCEWASEVRGEILVFADGDWEKNEELYKAIKTSTFANVILPASLKRQLQDDFRQFFGARDLYKQYGIPWKRGALFIGPPGNGKTHTVKALVNELGRPCLLVKGFKSEYATDEENIGVVFKRARMAAPCVLVFEDLDAMIDDKNRAFFLNELDGFESNTGLVVLATTNHPDRLDPAILNRPSRFDRKYYFELPAASERCAYVAAWNNQLQPDLRLSQSAVSAVVQQTEDFSFAYMKELFVSATMHWMSTKSEPVAGSPRAAVVTTVSATTDSMDRIILEEVARLRAQMAAVASVATGGRVSRSIASARRMFQKA